MEEHGWHTRSGRIQWRTGGCTMSGYEGRERQTRWWGESEKVRGPWSGGSGLAYANRLWWMPVLIPTVLVTAACWSNVVGCDQATRHSIQRAPSSAGWSTSFLHIFFHASGYRYFVFYLQQEGVCLIHEVYRSHSFLWVLHQLVAVIVLIPKTAAAVSI